MGWMPPDGIEVTWSRVLKHRNGTQTDQQVQAAA